MDARAGAMGHHAIPWHQPRGRRRIPQRRARLSGGYFGDRLGFEFDVQRYHHFFKDKNVDLVPNNCVSGVTDPRASTSIPTPWSFMGNVVAPIRSSGAKWRPYGTAGLGVIHAWVDGPATRTTSSRITRP